MIVIGEDLIDAFRAKHAPSAGSLAGWKKTMEARRFRHMMELRQVFRSADSAKQIFTVFNIGGNKYRLVAQVGYGNQVVNIRHIFTHAECDDWCRR